MTASHIDFDQRRARLYERFCQQQRFAASTSPLTACLCGLVAEWLNRPSSEEELAQWLVEVSTSCSSVAVPMLLLAAVHEAVLSGAPAVRTLAVFFPSVGGRQAVDSDALRSVFHQAVWACRQRLAAAFRQSAVQTNETSRGLCWLLPVVYTNWPAMHLVDLGCSAGLNLVADQRRYHLCGAMPGHGEMHLGAGVEESFLIPWRGDFVAPQQQAVPRILSRLGCDRHPLALTNAANEQRLLSFVWGDQQQRLTMLRQGIAALHRVASSSAPVRLVAADLPDEVEAVFDAYLPPAHTAPVVVYNTYLTSYLPCKGRDLETQVQRWATRQAVPVLWLQWEPLRHGAAPPALGWIAWTADVWLRGEHHRWHLAWVHPHGNGIEWLPDLIDWDEFWRQQGTTG